MKRKFKKVIAAIMIVVIMLQMTGCAGKKNSSNNGDALKQLESCWKNVLINITNTTDADMSDNATIEEYEKFEADIEAVVVKLEDDLAEIKTISSDDENVKKTIEAAKEFVSEYIEVLDTTKELVVMMKFAIAISDCVANTEGNPFENETYKAWVEEYNKVEFSDYLSQTMEYYNSALDIAKIGIEHRNGSMISEGNIDPFEYYSANTVDLWAVEKIVEAGSNLIDVFTVSLAQIEELSNGRLATMQKEITDNIVKLKEGQSITEYSYTTEEKTVSVSYTGIEEIYPAEYNSDFSLLYFDVVCNQGDTDILVKAEVEGLTQVYEQTFSVGRELTRVYVKPPIDLANIDLSAPYTAQLKLTITSTDGSEVFYQKTDNVNVLSMRDYKYESPVDVIDLLNWVTPNSEEIVQLNRYATEILQQSQVTPSSIVGYQGADSLMEYYNVTGTQINAIMYAISNVGVRYNNTAFSLNALQSVLLPKEVLTHKSGICLDLTLLVASSLEAAGFHTFLLITTGHAQVAVEVQENSGEYYIIECTALPAQNRNTYNFQSFDQIGVDQLEMNAVINYLTHDQILTYFEQKEARVIDCSLANSLNIEPLIQ